MMKNTKSHDSSPAEALGDTPGGMPSTPQSSTSSINAFLPTRKLRLLRKDLCNLFSTSNTSTLPSGDFFYQNCLFHKHPYCAPILEFLSVSEYC